MKKITKYLIIPLFSIFAFFLLFNTNVSAEMSGGVVVDPGDNSGDITVNPPPIQGEELLEQCHTYITTNIISAESLTEALNGKIYGNFTQEDCMEMINIASKREVIKNLVNINDLSQTTKGGVTYSYSNQVLTLNGTATDSSPQLGVSIDPVVLTGDYTFALFFEGEYKSGGLTLFFTLVDSEGRQLVYCQPSTNVGAKCSRTHLDINSTAVALRFWAHEGDVFNNFKVRFQLEKGRRSTRYVSYDYHNEYYQEGITDADNRVNTNSTSYTQGVIDADNRVNTNSTNYKTGEKNGYEMAYKDGDILGGLIPTVFGSIVSNTLPFLTYEVFGISLMDIIGIICMLGIVIVIIKFFV